MRFHQYAGAILLIMAVPGLAQAQLYSEDFEVDPTANWTVNRATNVDDPQSHPANFFFDYSTVGISSAPNSDPGDTRGMKLQSNMDFDNDGVSGVPTGGVTGMSVSPNGQSFTGDYVVKFDAWGNFPGPFPLGSNGTTQMSTFGVGTAGNFPNYPGSADGVWFAASHDGGTASDYRAYSQERNVSYQIPGTVPEDAHATHHAGSRNNTAQLYLDTFEPHSAPPAQTTLYPQQTGETADGVFGMEWHEIEISKIGNIYDWKVDGTSLITVDGTNFTTQPAGTNILFGSSDINAGASTDFERFNLLFTLIDNIVVEAVEEPGLDGDFNADGNVDAADYVMWAKDNTVGTYEEWVANFGESNLGGGGGGGAPVPEPGTAALAIVSLLMAALYGRRRG